MTASPEWAQVNAGPWLAEALAGLRGPQALAAVDAGPDLHATLRPYQQIGLRWLHLLSRLRLGVAEHAQLGSDRIGELPEGDARLAVATCAEVSGVAKSTTSSGDRLFVTS